MISRSVRDDAGISLVELIIIVAVLSVLVSLFAVTFVTGLTTQQQTAERSAATAQLNAATTSITESVRASADARVSASGQRLDAKVLLTDGGTWECRAWQLQSGELLYSAGTTALPSADASWASLTSGVEGNLSAAAAFEESGTRISLGLEITRGEVKVAVTDGALSQVISAGGPACW
ncbi:MULTISPECIES: hypothetical protein [Bacteria]